MRSWKVVLGLFFCLALSLLLTPLVLYRLFPPRTTAEEPPEEDPPSVERRGSEREPGVYHLTWDPTVGGNRWSNPANWRNTDTGERSDHAPGLGNPKDEDHVTFDGTSAANLGQDADDVVLFSLDVTAAYTGTIYLNHSVKVKGNGGTLAGGTIDVGSRRDAQGDWKPGGTLEFAGGNVSWTGTHFTAATLGPGDAPGKLLVHDGATMAVSGPDRRMGASLHLGGTLIDVPGLPALPDRGAGVRGIGPTEAAVSKVTVSGMNGSVHFGDRAEVVIGAKGELHLNNDNAEGTAGSFVTSDPSHRLLNYGLIERNGTGTVQVGFPIWNLVLTSKLWIDAGTLWVNVPAAALQEAWPKRPERVRLSTGVVDLPAVTVAIKQSHGATRFQGGTNAVLKMPQGGFLMTEGTFETKGGGGATVDAKFVMSAGVIKLASDQTSNDGQDGSLVFTDQVSIYGGTVFMKVYNPKQGARHDLLSSNVGVDVKDAASLWVSYYGTAAPGAYFDVITAPSAAGGTGITGGFGNYGLGNLNKEFKHLDRTDVLRLTPI
jgi:hypothetical protein